MKRFSDWQSRLERFLTANRARRFQYGAWDCALFACDCIREMTGADPAELFRGRYNSRSGAVAAIAEYAGSSSLQTLAVWITKDNAMPEVPVASAGRGDVVLIKRPRDFSLGIVALNGRSVLTLTRKGIQQVPLSTAVRAWRV